MIYLQNTTEVQELFIPVSSRDESGTTNYKLLLYNTVNLTNTVEEHLRTDDFNNDFNADFARSVLPVLTPGGSYYWLTIELPENAPNGTYEYALVNGNTMLAHGVLMVGDFKAGEPVVGELEEDIQYEMDIEYEQYNKEIEYEQYNG